MARLSHEEKQKRLDHSSIKPLYFAENIKIKTLGDVIYQLFFSGDPMCTFIKNDEGKFKSQKTGRARSIEDTYLLARTYLNGIDYATVYKAVEYFYFKHNSWPSLYPSYCYTVRRRVHGIGRIKTKEQTNSELTGKGLNYVNK